MRSSPDGAYRLKRTETVGHIVIVLSVMVGTTILAATGHLASDAVVGLYGAAVGYSGGAVSRSRGYEEGARSANGVQGDG